MFLYLKKKVSFLEWQSHWFQIGFPFIILSIIFMVLGCNSTSPKQLYTNPEFGISLEKPGNWSLEFYERNGLIVLETENRNNDSARIEIYGYACVSSSLPNNSEDVLESNIDRLRARYGSDSVTMIQEPIKDQIRGNEVTTTTVSMLTMSLPEDSVKNQVGGRGLDIIQIIDMFTIRDSEDNFIILYIYKGRNDKLNIEAEEIVTSIELVCPPKP